MKYSLVLTICLLLIVFLAGSMVFYLRSQSLEQVQTQNEDVPVTSQPGIEFPPDQVITEIPVIPSSENNTSIRSIVMADAALIPDAANEGKYIVYGEATACADEFDCQFPFSITYDQTTDFFTIVLYEAPLSSARDRAKAVLMERFGVSAEAVCLLNYMVSTPFWVSENFAGVDLRLSGCSGAVQL